MKGCDRCDSVVVDECYGMSVCQRPAGHFGPHAGSATGIAKGHMLVFGPLAVMGVGEARLYHDCLPHSPGCLAGKIKKN